MLANLPGEVKVIPGYSVIEQLDEDPVATTYLVSDGGEAVLTVARQAVPPDGRTAFRQWANALLGIADGPGIARVHAADITADGKPYLVVATGDVLGDLLQEQGPLPLATVCQHALTLADGLARAHAADVFHGTVQPATVLVLDESAALAGFGAVAPGLTVATAADAYTPPEHLPDAFVQRAVATAAGDVYQLALTTYVALGGVVPWEASPLDLGTRTTPLADVPGVEGGLVELLRAATAPDPVLRPTAEQFRDHLAALQVEGESRNRVIPPELLAGRGVRKVGRRTAALVALAGGGLSATTTAFLGRSATTASTPTALPVIAALPAVGPAIPAATAATVATAAATTSITKVVVITALTVVVGGGAGIAIPQFLDGAPCDSVVGDRSNNTVLVDSAKFLSTGSYGFTLRYGKEVDAEGAFDSAARRASVVLKPPGEYVGEIRLDGDDLAMTGPVAKTPPGQWKHQKASSNVVARTVLAVPETVPELLGRTEQVQRDGCTFTGQFEQARFEATIEETAGDLRSLRIDRLDLDLRITAAVPPAEMPTTSAPPARTNLTGRWEKGNVSLLINSQESAAGIMRAGEPICTGRPAGAGTKTEIPVNCLPGTARPQQFRLRVELVDNEHVSVSGNVQFAGTYRLAQS
ncbi:hypothetical protein KIPE111705_07660 [Kibdelosporangium persicum]|uniref:Protein kinase domain-containing protein n=1 Tax=Kibdelosporangium persicum TaxID=2698649 RepID=A0ABX2F2Z2_9PSEU|nr:Protein kinase domain-containing protein [Kibdelosporangium persicum]